MPRPYIDDGDVQILVGDALQVLRGLPDGSVDCCVTSPPYLGLRDYGVDGQLGLEPTIGEYVEKLVAIFAEVRRVLADHGTVWLNLGDSYNAYNGGAGPSSALSQTQSAARPRLSTGFGLQQKELKPKDLMGVPWRVAFALQADGWWLRSDIVWAKPNPMPESVTDRPTKAHEYVFLLSKRPSYWFDQEAVREPAEWARWGDQTYSPEAEKMYGQRIPPRPKDHFRNSGKYVEQGAAPSNSDHNGNRGEARGFDPTRGRNVRSVWEIATQPYPDAHFATFPEELPRRCILAGCPEWVCVSCGKARERLVEVEYENPGNRTTNGPRSLAQRHETAGFDQRLERRAETVGWSDCGCVSVSGCPIHDMTYFHGDQSRHDGVEYPPCVECEPATASGAHRWRPGTVLDPFLGSGTTAHVARKHGRKCVGIELNPAYAELAARRLQQLSLLADGAA